jgi:hypothetical protein
MTSFKASTTAACLAATLCLATVARAETPAAEPKGEVMMASATVTATVLKINQETREVTVKTDDGKEHTFVASEDVKNLAQVKPGDVITATYGEALAYEVKKGGQVADIATVVAGGAAAPGSPTGRWNRPPDHGDGADHGDRPEGALGYLQGAAGQHPDHQGIAPEKLEGVSVGDTVELTFTEAFAVKVEAAPEK